MFLIPIGLVLSARTDDMGGLALAYLNVLLMGSAMVYFARRTFEGMVPGTFLVWSMLCFPITAIYYCLANPDAAYGTMTLEVRRILDGTFRVQAATMAFIVCYLATIFLLQPRKGKTIASFSAKNPATRKFAYFAAAISMVAFACGLYARVTVNYESGFGYLISGIFNYLATIPMIIGVLFPKISRSVRLVVVGFFALTSPVYLLYHSRSNLLLPWVMMTFGLLFFSEWPQRKKKWL